MSRIFLAGLLALTLLFSTHCNRTPVWAAPATPAAPVEAFELSAVTLLDGPLKEATELNKASLLRYDPDRLLARFRTEAGLEPKAESYGGWEGMSLAGHSLGHHLSACALMYQSTGDERFRERATYIVGELAAVQEANGGGYLGAFPNGQRVFEEEVAQGNITTQSFDLNGIWAPFYTHHKVMAGLRDAYRLLGIEQALEVERRFADWIGTIVLDLSNEQVQRMLNCEFGGIQEVLADLYADTQEEKYLRIARVFHHEAVIDPLRAGEDILPGIHGNTQIPKLIAAARLYELEGKETDRKPAEFFWDRVVNHHSYVTGGHGNHEYFGEPDQLRNRLSDETTETCNVYNMLKLSRHLLLWEPRAEVADYYERALWNHIRSTQHPETGRVIYNLSLEMGGYKEYQDPEWFTCCIGSGMENHSKYGANIYYHNDRELYVSQFIGSTVDWPDKGLTLTQTTGFPEEPGTELTMTLAEPQTFALYLRYPSWAQSGYAIQINDTEQQLDAEPGSFIRIERAWRGGDRVAVTFPFSLRLEAMPDDSSRIAVRYGPLVLAGDLGAVDDERVHTPDFVPVFITQEREPANWLTPVAGEPNTFRSIGVGQPREVTFRPFYQVHDRRYSVYFDLYTAEGYEAHLAALEAERERKAQLEARTFDGFQPGDSLSEVTHRLRGEQLNQMRDFKGRQARGAERGGWLAFDMAIPPGQPVDLVIEYWGGFTGSKTFDILVDGERIATENISGKKDGHFLDVTYPLPAALTAGKERVTVRFDPHTGHRAGPFFYVRTVGRVGSPES